MSTRRPNEDDPRVRLYRQVVRDGWTCQHGEPAGWVVRPWCGTPGCAQCRRQSVSRWRSVETAARLAADGVAR